MNHFILCPGFILLLLAWHGKDKEVFCVFISFVIKAVQLKLKTMMLGWAKHPLINSHFVLNV